MLTEGLTKLIAEGKAKEQTFVFGAGSVGRIPVPPNSFIIIHQFDYWHFIDLPENVQVNAPAHGILNLFFALATPPFDILVDLGIGNVVVTLDPTNPAQFLIDVLAGMAIFAPGWTASLIVTTTGFQLNFITTSPGAIYNGIIPSGASILPPPPAYNYIGVAFVGGLQASPLTLEQFLSHSIHQVEFRSSKSRNHYIIQEPVEVFDWQYITGDSFQYFANCSGVYKKDCYLVHDEAVKIDVVSVPPVEAWLTSRLQLNDKSQEDAKPVGYGVNAGGEPTVRQVFFDGVGLTQQYFPLTFKFGEDSALPLIPGEFREQFKVDVNPINILFPPQNKGGVRGNFRTYPLINISYVVVNMNVNQFVKGS